MHRRIPTEEQLPGGHFEAVFRVLASTAVIRPWGNAIIMVFDLYTLFSVGLIFVLTRYAKFYILKTVHFPVSQFRA